MSLVGQVFKAHRAILDLLVLKVLKVKPVLRVL